MPRLGAKMPEFLALLANLYLCDAITDIRHLTMQEMAECNQAQGAVHTYFAPFDLAPAGTADHAEQLAAAEVAFQTWEETNPDLVADMHAAAWLSVRRTGSVLCW